MKKILSLFLFFCLSTVANAQLLEAKPVKDLFDSIENTQFSYNETGMLFGFESIKSCVFSSDNIIVIKNYCSPKKVYPAKGYTIISTKFGIIDLYQEELSEDILKRDVQITAFPEILKPYNADLFIKVKIEKINNTLKTLYYQNTPGCWSTNYSYASNEPAVDCSTKEVDGFQMWAKETQDLTANVTSWKKLIEKLDQKFNE